MFKLLQMKLHGSIALNENIADNGGLHIAYRAFKKHENNHGSQRKVPGFENFTSDQLFFFGFASVSQNKKLASYY